MPKKSEERHTHSTAAALGDALAVALELVVELEAALEYARARVKKIESILHEARAGPHAYDPERPAGPRGKLRRR